MTTHAWDHRILAEPDGLERAERDGMPRWREELDLEPAILRFVYDGLWVESAWCVRDPDGFTWWASRHAQHVRLEVARAGGEVMRRVIVRTEVVRDIAWSPERWERLGDQLAGPGMAAVVADPDRGTIDLVTAMPLDPQRGARIAHYLRMAATLAAAQAPAFAATLVARLGSGAPAWSPHPEHGLRPEPSPLGVVVEAMAAIGNEPSFFRKATLEDEAGHLAPLIVAHVVLGTELVLIVPFGDALSGVTVDPDAPGPLGAGLGLTLVLPANAGTATPERAAALNRVALDPGKGLFTIGSWCAEDGRFIHRTWVPSLVNDGDGAIPYLALGTVAANAWAARELAADGSAIDPKRIARMRSPLGIGAPPQPASRWVS